MPLAAAAMLQFMSSAGKLHQRLWLFGNQTDDFNPNDRIDPSGFPTKQRWEGKGRSRVLAIKP